MSGYERFERPSYFGNVFQLRATAGVRATASWADYSNTSHRQWAGTKNSNILENKQRMEDSHTDPHPCVGSVPIKSDRRCWGSEEQRPIS